MSGRDHWTSQYRESDREWPEYWQREYNKARNHNERFALTPKERFEVEQIVREQLAAFELKRVEKESDKQCQHERLRYAFPGQLMCVLCHLNAAELFGQIHKVDYTYDSDTSTWYRKE